MYFSFWLKKEKKAKNSCKSIIYWTHYLILKNRSTKIMRIKTIPSKHLPAQIQQQKKVQDIFKLNNKNTRTTSLTWFWCLHRSLTPNTLHTFLVFLLLTLKLWAFVCCVTTQIVLGFFNIVNFWIGRGQTCFEK